MTNKAARKELERIFGKECMFEKAKIAEKIEQFGGIKTYKRYLKDTKFRERKLRKLRKILTYHHLIHVSECGGTDINNGSILSLLAHRYIHSLPREQEEIINNWLRQYKNEYILNAGILIPTDRGLEILEPLKLSFDMDFSSTDCIVIPVYDTTEKQANYFRRAKRKQEDRRIIEEGLFDYLDRED